MEQKKIVAEIIDEVKQEILPFLKRNIKLEILPQLKNEIKQEIKQEILQEIAHLQNGHPLLSENQPDQPSLCSQCAKPAVTSCVICHKLLCVDHLVHGDPIHGSGRDSIPQNYCHLCFYSKQRNYNIIWGSVAFVFLLIIIYIIFQIFLSN